MIVRLIRNESTHSASVSIPSSKSISHRMLIAAALSPEVSEIQNLSVSEDIHATVSALGHLGVIFENTAEGMLVHGTGDPAQYDGKPVDCRESGSTLRFLIPLFSMSGKKTVFTGQGKLMQRPLSVYESIFEKQNLCFKKENEKLTIEGKLKPGLYQIPGNISSQFISGLLLALPLLSGDSVIEILPPLESGSYVRLSEAVLKEAGIDIHEDGLKIEVPGNQKYRPLNTSVEGDMSQAAFFGCLAMIRRMPIEICGLNPESAQGDAVFMDILKSMGAEIHSGDHKIQVIPQAMHAAEIDLADCPDLGPALFALASQAEGISVFHHIERLRLKESDRVSCMQEELKKLGVQMEQDKDTVLVHGRAHIAGGVQLNGHQDHRIVMALSVLSACAESPVQINGAEAVSKSYPNFFEDLKKAGMKVEII